MESIQHDLERPAARGDGRDAPLEQREERQYITISFRAQRTPKLRCDEF